MDEDGPEPMSVDENFPAQQDNATLARREAAKKTLPWIEKYRPSTLHDLISHDEIVRTCTLLFELHIYWHLIKWLAVFIARNVRFFCRANGQFLNCASCELD